MKVMLFLVGLVVVGACGGKELTADCHGDTYCHWDEVPAGHLNELCCPRTYPYCGEKGTSCPPGFCCNVKP